VKYTVPGGGDDIAVLAVGDAPLPGELFAAALVVGVDPPVALLELDDPPPPHAVSSNAADTRPAAATHPLLRITYSISEN
jgi:hypothetical protein